AEFLVDHLGHRRQAVGGAGGVGNYVVLLRVVLILIDAQNYGQVFVFRRGADDDFLDAAPQMGLGQVGVGENTRGLHHDVYAQLIPGDVVGLPLLENPHVAAVHGQAVFLDRHLVGQDTEGAVVLEQMGQ